MEHTSVGIVATKSYKIFHTRSTTVSTKIALPQAVKRRESEISNIPKKMLSMCIVALQMHARLGCVLQGGPWTLHVIYQAFKSGSENLRNLMICCGVQSIAMDRLAKEIDCETMGLLLHALAQQTCLQTPSKKLPKIREFASNHQAKSC